MANINSGANTGKGIQGQDDKKPSPSATSKVVDTTAQKVVDTLKKK